MNRIFLSSYALTPIEKESSLGFVKSGANVLKEAVETSQIEKPDLLIVSNMLSDELEGQKHLGALFATEATWAGIESWHVRGAMASGAVALRAAYLALRSGEAASVAVLGIETMHGKAATPALAKALDAHSEIPEGHTMISINAALMQSYLERYGLPHEVFSNFAVNAHKNALSVEHSFLKKAITKEEAMNSRLIVPPIRLTDCAPVCDGAAAVILTSRPEWASEPRIELVASEVATDVFTVKNRKDPLKLSAARESARKAYLRTGLGPSDMDFFEAHDAFSIMACLALEACGFAEEGEGWRLAEDGGIFLEGRLPIATHGGLKARGHPIGATALYQVIEIARQLSGQAGKNQIARPLRHAMMQSIGGAGTTLGTHIFRV